MIDTDSDKETEPSVASSLPQLLLEDPDTVDASKSTLYKYRDFSTVADDDDDAIDSTPQTASSRGSSESSIRVQKFPVKLYAILAQKEFHDVIAWMPHGRSWKVLKPSLFESLVMPLFFEYSNYHSFNRLVNAWSFRRVSSGVDRGSYYHELFLRGKPHLQKYMRRLPKTHKKMPMNKVDQPNFYVLDKATPLPAIQDAPVPAGASASAVANCSNMPLMHQHPHAPHQSHSPLMGSQQPHRMVTPRGGQGGPPGYNNNMFNQEFAGSNEEYENPIPLRMGQFRGDFHGMPPANSNNNGYGRPMQTQQRMPRPFPQQQFMQQQQHDMEPLQATGPQGPPMRQQARNNQEFYHFQQMKMQQQQQVQQQQQQQMPNPIMYERPMGNNNGQVPTMHNNNNNNDDYGMMRPAPRPMA